MRPRRRNNNTVWEYRSLDPTAEKRLEEDLHIHKILAQVLASRKMDSPSEAFAFLNPRLSAIKDPYLLRDMDKAVDRFVKAVKNHEKICIYGDYDVDGITATVLLIRFLKWLDRDVDYYVPSRITEGYGMNCSAIERIAQKKTTLLITVDNGISALKEVAYASSLGMDVIITDHHQSGHELPAAVAIVNPNRKDAPYLDTPFAGVGVAFKFVHAACRGLGIESEHAKRFLSSMLDLVALGTVADIVPLTGENRILVKFGLQKLQTTDKLGLSTLTQLACSPDKDLTPEAVSYNIAPRINAAGRTDQASLCIDLLLTEDQMKAIEISRQLNRLNEERRRLEADILEACLSYLTTKEKIEEQSILVVQGEGWHVGVLGIVASRLLERFKKPAIVLTLDKDTARGSGRSIQGFDLFQALEHCDEYLLDYGGHQRAVGLTLKTSDIAEFRKAINQYAEGKIDAALRDSVLFIDAEINAEDLTLDTVSALSALEPYGTANPPPLFSMRNVSLLEQPRIVGQDHVKLYLCQEGIGLQAIAFSMADLVPQLSDTSRSFDIAFTPYINKWKGYQNVELEIKDIKFNNKKDEP